MILDRTVAVVAAKRVYSITPPFIGRNARVDAQIVTRTHHVSCRGQSVITGSLVLHLDNRRQCTLYTPITTNNYSSVCMCVCVCVVTFPID